MQKSSSFNNLLFLFKDQPEVVELLNPLMVDATQAGGDMISSLLKEEHVFDTRVNLYVTGKSKVGKSTLGNKLFGDTILPSTGHVDCTDGLYVAAIGSNILYFDLPGAGMGEVFEGINRDILLMGGGNNPAEFKMIQKIAEKENTTIIKREDWAINQKNLLPHVCIYMIAPHVGLFNSDVTYLNEFLTTFKKRFGEKDRIIFALNLHTKNGQPCYSEDDLEDVTLELDKAYRSVFGSSQCPSILNINAINGNGLQELIQEICGKLKLSKIQSFYNKLSPGLDEKAGKIKEQRFLKLLCFLGSRLSVAKADSSILNRNLLYEAYLSIYIYGLLVFFNEEPDEELIGADISDLSSQTIKSKEDIVKVNVPITAQEEIKKKILVDEYIDVPKRESYVEVTKVRVQRHYSPILGLGIRDYLFPIYEDVEEKNICYRTVTVKEYKGQREETITVDVIEKIIGYNETVIHKGYLSGGFEFIESIFSLGLGTNLALRKKPEDTFEYSFLNVYTLGKDEATKILAPYKSEIENIILDYPIVEEAEIQIRKLLFKIFNIDK